MGYLHIENLYRKEAQDILLFKECYALEKIHGTSARIQWKDNSVKFFSGGESHDKFVALFDKEGLTKAFAEFGQDNVCVYGEAYGGKQQKMSATYGDKLKFIVFDVKINGCWLTVPQAEEIATKRLGLEFVYYTKVKTDVSILDSERDRPSVQAIRNGVSRIVAPNDGGAVEYPGIGWILNPRKREGVVLRSPIEVIKNNGERIICKHKGDDFRETATPRKVIDPNKQAVLDEADKIALEWVTPNRLDHVLQKISIRGIQDMPIIIKAMLEDISREAKGEIVESSAANKAIARETAKLFKKRLQTSLCN